MADVLSFDPLALSLTIRHPGGAFTPRAVRDQAGSRPAGQAQTKTVALTLSGSPAFEGDATLAKLAGASWLTIPATCQDGTLFDVTIDGRDLDPGDYSETIRASKDGYDDQDCVVTVAVRPMG